jgi:prepilin-type N-terminal cleavage/methylation domain-containing protein
MSGRQLMRRGRQWYFRAGVPADLRAHSRKRAGGFTLIELLVTMSVAAMLAAIAIPGFTSMAQGERRVAEVNDLVLALNYARSEAVKQDSTAGVNVIANGSWDGGWSVCCTSTGATVTSISTLDSRTQLTASIGGVTPVAVSFSGNGAQLAPLGTVLFTFCDSRGPSAATAVEVSPQGKIQTGALPGFRVDQTTPLVCP